MFKVLQFKSGPYSEAGYVWCVAEIEDADGNIHLEEIYYDTIEEAFLDLEEFEGQVFIIDDDDLYLTEEEESEVDQW